MPDNTLALAALSCFAGFFVLDYMVGRGTTAALDRRGVKALSYLDAAQPCCIDRHTCAAERKWCYRARARPVFAASPQFRASLATLVAASACDGSGLGCACAGEQGDALSRFQDRLG